jgi:hypothetical protein
MPFLRPVQRPSGSQERLIASEEKMQLCGCILYARFAVQKFMPVLTVGGIV